MHNNLVITTVEVGSFLTNCYIISDPNSNECIIIDPGDDADYLMRVLNDNNFIPKKIIATHGHADHILAAKEIQLAYKIPFLIHKKDYFLVKNMPLSGKYFYYVTAMSPEINGFLVNNQLIKLGKNNIKIIETPGHTPGSICLYLNKEKLIFSGDLIFAGGGIGRTDLSYSQKSQLIISIKKIMKLSLELKIYPGHGDSTIVKNEKNFHKDIN